MSTTFDAKDGDARGEEKLEWCPRPSAADREMARFSHDGVGRYAPLHEVGKRRDTPFMPLVTRIEHGDERPGIEQHVARSSWAGGRACGCPQLLAPVVAPELRSQCVALDGGRIDVE